MSFAADHALFFLLASIALVALALPRDGTPGAAERFGWLAILASLGHPLATVLADAYRIDGDLTPFLACDLVAIAALAAAAANRAPGGKLFYAATALAAVALPIAAQQLPLHGPGVSSPLLAAVLLCVMMVAAAAECARHAKLFRESSRSLHALALLCGASAVLLLVSLLLLAGSASSAAAYTPLLGGAGLLWLTLKLMMTAALLQLFAARRNEQGTVVQRALVAAANEAVTDLRVSVQAFYQLPVKALVADQAGRLLFATADARRQLGYPELDECTLEQLFVVVQPVGHLMVRALHERPDHHAQLLDIRMGAVECRGKSYHLLQIEAAPFDFAAVRSLLVESRNDDAHEATGLLDQNFAIVAMADGWSRLMEPFDRYASSGVFWDKLKLLSASDGEIQHLEAMIASTPEATGWFRMRNGGGLSVSVRRLQTPDQKPFYRVALTLVDELRATDAGAPCAGGNGGLA